MHKVFEDFKAALAELDRCEKQLEDYLTNNMGGNPNGDLADAMIPYEGVPEYTGIVADIQKWYYGSLVKAPWCATAVSYFANLAGWLEAIGGKAENVNIMRENCRKNPLGLYYNREEVRNGLDIKKGDILFFLWNARDIKSLMTNTSSKHVGVAKCDVSGKSEMIECIGGNQDDKICTKLYSRYDLYAVYRPRG